mgnify:CR=1 FL=1
MKAQGRSLGLCHFSQLPEMNCSRHREASREREGGGRGKAIREGEEREQRQKRERIEVWKKNSGGSPQ